MVVGRHFTWTHLPKTGGDATRDVFEQIGDLTIVPSDHPTKHRPFGFAPCPGDDREYWLNIRRLPAWLLSVYEHRTRFGWLLSGAPQTALTLHRMAESGYGDLWLYFLTQGGAFTVTRWIRQEDLVNDLSEALATIGVSCQNAWMRNVNVLASYEHDVTKRFTEEEIAIAYERNPVWRRIEERVYG